MSAVPQSMSATSFDRRIQMLRTAMGPLIAAALEDPDVVEVMLNSLAFSPVRKKLNKSGMLRKVRAMPQLLS